VVFSSRVIELGLGLDVARVWLFIVVMLYAHIFIPLSVVIVPHSCSREPNDPIDGQSTPLPSYTLSRYNVENENFCNSNEETLYESLVGDLIELL